MLLAQAVRSQQGLTLLLSPPRLLSLSCIPRWDSRPPQATSRHRVAVALHQPKSPADRFLRSDGFRGPQSCSVIATNRFRWAVPTEAVRHRRRSIWVYRFTCRGNRRDGGLDRLVVELLDSRHFVQLLCQPARVTPVICIVVRLRERSKRCCTVSCGHEKAPKSLIDLEAFSITAPCGAWSGGAGVTRTTGLRLHFG